MRPAGWILCAIGSQEREVCPTTMQVRARALTTNHKELETKHSEALDAYAYLLQHEGRDEDMALLIQAECGAFLAWNQYGNTNGKGGWKEQNPALN